MNTVHWVVFLSVSTLDMVQRMSCLIAWGHLILQLGFVYEIARFLGVFGINTASDI